MPNKISDIKNMVEENLGREVVVTANMGRKKKKVRKGIISNSYPSIFVVSLTDAREQFDCVSYSYIDILTNTIDVEFVTSLVD